MITTDDPGARPEPGSAGSWLPRLLPTILFVVLCGLTVAVWYQQVRHQRAQLRRHTRDVCHQAARRLQAFIGNRLTVSRMFARRWATHEERDFSRQRFLEFAKVLIGEIQGYRAMSLVSRDGQTLWVAPPGATTVLSPLGPVHRRLLRLALEQGRAVLSEPVPGPHGRPTIFAVKILRREKEFLGYLLVGFDTERLVQHLFLQLIRAEFNFRITDGERLVHCYAPDGEVVFRAPTVVETNAIQVANRRWRLTMVPRREQIALAGWRANLAVPLLGLFLSLVVGGLVYLLGRRGELHRIARDRAERALAERERAEEAMRLSEARYRSVFDSATNGLLVLDERGQVVEANRAACEMHGYGPGALAGHHVRGIIAADSPGVVDGFLEGLQRTGKGRLDTVNRRADGSTIDVEVRGTSFRPGDEQRFLVVITDVSERKRAEWRLTLLSRKVLKAQEEERARLSRDLHDELGQLLTALRFELGLLQKRALAGEAGEQPFSNAISLTENAAEELRRVCRGLRPPLLDDLGLGAAVESLIEEFQEHATIRVDLNVALGSDDRALPADKALCTYRILQEALTNVRRHAGATAVRIKLRLAEEELRLSVYDDGQGFATAVLSHGAGSGIAGMAERAHLVGGEIEVTSEPHQGTLVAFRVPVPESGEKGESS